MDFKPQACTMSVALLDQGEMVPNRGITKSFCADSTKAAWHSPDKSKSSSLLLSSLDSWEANLAK